MDKPEWCSAEIWSASIEALGVPDDDDGWHLTADVLTTIARAILSAQSQADIDAARIAISHGEKWGADGVEGWIVARDIEEDILQRKEGMK